MFHPTQGRSRRGVAAGILISALIANGVTAATPSEGARDAVTVAIEQGPLLSSSHRREIEADLTRRFAENPDAIRSMPPADLRRLVEAFEAVGVPPAKRGALLLRWVKSGGDWKAVGPGGLADLFEAMGQVAANDRLDAWRAEATKWAWQNQLTPDKLQPTGADRRGILRLAAVLAGRLDAKPRESLRAALEQKLVKDRAALAALPASDLELLERALRNLGTDVTGLEAAQALVAWVDAREGQPPPSAAELAEAIRLLARHRGRDTFLTAQRRLVEPAWDSYLRELRPSTAAPGTLELAAAAVPSLSAERKADLLGRLRGYSGADRASLASLSPARLESLWTACADLGMPAPEQADLVAAWLADPQRSGPTASPVALVEALEIGRATRAPYKDHAALIQARAAAEKRAAERLADPAFVAQYGVRGAAPVARALAVGEGPDGRAGLRGRLEAAWFAQPKFFEGMTLADFEQLRTLWAQLGQPLDGNGALAARWVSASQAWKDAGAWESAQLLTMLGYGRGGGVEAAREAVAAHAKAKLADPSYFRDPPALDLAELIKALGSKLEAADRTAIRRALFERLENQDASGGPGFAVGELNTWGRALLLLAGSPQPAGSAGGGDTTDPKAADAVLADARASGKGVAAAAMAFGGAFRATNRLDAWKEYADARIADATVTGDAKAAWLLARGYAEEIELVEPPTPLLGMPWVEKAFGNAQSEPLRLRALRWMVARQLAVQQFTEAASLLKSVEAQFESQAGREQLAAMKGLIERERGLEEKRQAKIRRQLEVGQLQGQADTLKRQLDDARKQGRSAEDLASLERVLQNTQDKLDEVRKQTADRQG